MNLLSIREAAGPYWRAYQIQRRRDGIFKDPDFVPEWFMKELLQARLSETRTAIAQLAPPSAHPMSPEYVAVIRALDTLEGFLGRGSLLDPHRLQFLAGMLGAMEVEIDRERLAEGLDRPYVECSRCLRELGLSKTCAQCQDARSNS